ncbi:MAG: ribosome biogenesis GTPase YlqF [Bacillota bacterium]
MVNSWYPGHMVKARREILENLKLVDVVVEIADARAPQSTRNLELENLVKPKPVILVLNKKDLVNSPDLDTWVRALNREGLHAVGMVSTTGEGKKQVIQMVEKMYQPRMEAMRLRQLRPRPPRIMVVGIPNVGKSTFINTMVGRKTARTGPKPGVTRGKQWVRVDGRIDLLDTPGLLWPKITIPDQGLKLAALGVLGSKAYSEEEVARYIIRMVQKIEPQALESRYGIENILLLGEDQVLQAIARFRGFSGDCTDDQKTAHFVLSEFRRGRIAKIILDQIE